MSFGPNKVNFLFLWGLESLGVKVGLNWALMHTHRYTTSAMPEAELKDARH